MNMTVNLFLFSIMNLTVGLIVCISLPLIDKWFHVFHCKWSIVLYSLASWTMFEVVLFCFQSGTESAGGKSIQRVIEILEKWSPVINVVWQSVCFHVNYRISIELLNSFHRRVVQDSCHRCYIPNTLQEGSYFIYCEIIFIRWTFNFVFFLVRTIH